MMRSRHLPRVARVVRSPSPRLRTFLSTLWLKNSVVVGFKVVIESIFVTWLTNVLLEADFNAVRIDSMISMAERDLGLNVEMIKRLLVRHTAPRAEFRSDGELVTFQGD